MFKDIFESNLKKNCVKIFHNIEILYVFFIYFCNIKCVFIINKINMRVFCNNLQNKPRFRFVFSMRIFFLKHLIYINIFYLIFIIYHLSIFFLFITRILD